MSKRTIYQCTNCAVEAPQVNLKGGGGEMPAGWLDLTVHAPGAFVHDLHLCNACRGKAFDGVDASLITRLIVDALGRYRTLVRESEDQYINAERSRVKGHLEALGVAEPGTR
jgi:hypothetical protein